MEFMKAISSRQSCRAFTGEKVTESELETILQAANAAPVGNGKYENVKLTVIENQELLAKLEENTCKAIPGMFQHPIYGAATVIAIHCKKEDTLALANASAIAENMLLAATSLGLGSIYLYAVPAAAQYNPQLCAEMKVPEGFTPCVMVGVGHAQAALEDRQLTTDRIQTEYAR